MHSLSVVLHAPLQSTTFSYTGNSTVDWTTGLDYLTGLLDCTEHAQQWCVCLDLQLEWAWVNIMLMQTRTQGGFEEPP